ncbi:CpsB/CapC family capsule biosynthesis tyrosine phosphatase [Bacillus gobiensis]|uniref:CpsB/CapC family capsule biosynthesis tyrosine phosphatase n=1 Tax=Bacillus gobiensis TaxID=1441095 RepID=UPI003D1E49DD
MDSSGKTNKDLVVKAKETLTSSKSKLIRAVQKWSKILNLIITETRKFLILFGNHKIKRRGRSLLDDGFKSFAESIEMAKEACSQGITTIISIPFDHVPRYAVKLLFSIQIKRYIPIITHTERNRKIMLNPKRSLNLIKKGVESQVTASSHAGNFGKNIKKFSRQLIYGIRYT